MSGDDDSTGYAQQDGEQDYAQDGEQEYTHDGTGDYAENEGMQHEGQQSSGDADGQSEAATAITATNDAPLGTKIPARGDDDDKKIFVGGLHWETTASDLKEYFTQFGTVIDCTLKTDQTTGKSRGFGFVLFEDKAIVQKILADKSHSLRSRPIDCKPAQSSKHAAAKVEPVKKVFVGGLSPDLPETAIREHFGQYGTIEQVELPFDKVKNQRRAFCFITYETEEMVDKAVVNAKQKLGDKEVDVRKATPKSEQELAARGRGGMLMRGAYQPPYPGYAPPPPDYSGYYGMPGYGYGYPGYPPYDYSGYYGGQAADWSAYGGYAAYPGYDYSQYYAQAAAQGQPGGMGMGAGPAPPMGGGAVGANNFKAKRGGATSSNTTGYHPYSR